MCMHSESAGGGKNVQVVVQAAIGDATSARVIEVKREWRDRHDPQNPYSVPKIGRRVR